MKKRFYREGGMCDFYNKTYGPMIAKNLDEKADKWEQAELRRQNEWNHVPLEGNIISFFLPSEKGWNPYICKKNVPKGLEDIRSSLTIIFF